MNADHVFIESTYGDRLHEKAVPREDILFDIIKKTCSRGGKVLIPSFALERTQELLYSLSKLKTEREDFPDVKIFLDSPLAIKVTEVFKRHRDVYDEEARARRDNPFDFPGLVLSPTAQDSMAINKMDEPAVIIAGSGMCTAGRIRHHLKHGIWDSRNTLLFVGFQAQGTLGRVILDGAEEIRMMGQIFVVKAEIRRIHSFSAHADRDELIGWLEAFMKKPEKVFLIHGEEDTIKAFSENLEGRGFSTMIPRRGNNVMAGL
jgi:metallo-beta-lactamase family protein